MSELVYGWHAVLSVLRRAPETVVELWLSEARSGARAQELRQAAETAGVAVQRANRSSLDAMVGAEDHQGVVARVRAVAGTGQPQDLPGLLARLTVPPFLLVLDGVQDPHNLGACLRTADAVGAHAVIVPRDRAAPVTPVVRKVASGAAETVPVFAVTNLVRTLEQLKEAGVWLVGTAGEASKTLYEVDLKGPLALVLGSEGEGLRRLTRETCDFLVQIPMAGVVTSLNVSVAAGVCLYEACRQRGAPA